MVGTSLNTQIQRVEDKKGTLTNWNSVADPAPASAFLSAPAGMKNRFRFVIWSDLLQNKGRQVTQAHLARKVISVKDEVRANYTLQWGNIWATFASAFSWVRHLSQLTAQTIASSRKAALTPKPGLCALSMYTSYHWVTSTLQTSTRLTEGAQWREN